MVICTTKELFCVAWRFLNKKSSADFAIILCPLNSDTNNLTVLFFLTYCSTQCCKNYLLNGLKQIGKVLVYYRARAPRRARHHQHARTPRPAAYLTPSFRAPPASDTRYTPKLTISMILAFWECGYIIEHAEPDHYRSAPNKLQTSYLLSTLYVVKPSDYFTTSPINCDLLAAISDNHGIISAAPSFAAKIF